MQIKPILLYDFSKMLTAVGSETDKLYKSTLDVVEILHRCNVSSILIMLCVLMRPKQTMEAS